MHDNWNWQQWGKLISNIILIKTLGVFTDKVTSYNTHTSVYLNEHFIIQILYTISSNLSEFFLKKIVHDTYGKILYMEPRQHGTPVASTCTYKKYFVLKKNLDSIPRAISFPIVVLQLHFHETKSICVLWSTHHVSSPHQEVLR